jgi:hypothetical protein
MEVYKERAMKLFSSLMDDVRRNTVHIQARCDTLTFPTIIIIMPSQGGVEEDVKSRMLVLGAEARLG